MNRNDTKNLVCEFFSYYSEKTWHELKLVQYGRIRMNETTITQNLVKDLLVHSDLMRLPIYVYETKNESANGNDLEIWIETKHGFVLMPTQVKIIKKNRYPTISHKVGNVAQIDLLMNYAHKLNGIPAYLFYNYFDEIDFFDCVADKFPTLDEKQFGCTIGNAYSIYRDFYFRQGQRLWTIPSFTDIHVSSIYANPLLCVINRLIYGTVEELVSFIGKGYRKLLDLIVFLSFDQLQQIPSWEALFSTGRISGISDIPLMGDPFETIVEREPQMIRHIDSPDSFAPMYRIVISRTHQFGVYIIN